MLGLIFALRQVIVLIPRAHQSAKARQRVSPQGSVCTRVDAVHQASTCEIPREPRRSTHHPSFPFRFRANQIARATRLRVKEGSSPVPHSPHVGRAQCPFLGGASDGFGWSHFDHPFVDAKLEPLGVVGGGMRRKEDSPSRLRSRTSSGRGPG